MDRYGMEGMDWLMDGLGPMGLLVLAGGLVVLIVVLKYFHKR